MKYFLVILTMLFIAGCGGIKDVSIKATPVQPVVIHPPIPDQLQMREVKWTVFNREKIEKLLADYPNQEIVLFALSAKGYENLSLNMAEVIRYLKEQKGVIIYYREEFPSPDATGAEEEE
jgi:hypothetical protein